MIVKALRSQIRPNPYRDLEVTGIIPGKVDTLKKSYIASKSHWENVLTRWAGNVPPEFEIEDGDYAYDPETFEPIHFLEQGYGHTRYYVMDQMLEDGSLAEIKGVEVVEKPDGTKDYVMNVPVQDLDDPTMLKIMANENKDDGTNAVVPLLESVRQTVNILVVELSKAGTFNEYKDGGGKFFDSKASFDQLKGKEQVGAPQVAKFFGDTYSTNEVANALRTIKLIEVGLFAQEQVVNFPSAGMLKCFCAYAEAVWAKETWPEYFKRLTIDQMAETISTDPKDPSDRPTVRTVTAAAKGVAEDLHGDLMARKGATSRKWTPAIHIKETLKEDPELTDEQLIEQLGMGEFEGRDEIIKEGRKLYDQAQKKKEAGATEGEGADGGDGAGGELDQLVADAGSEVLTGEALPPVTDDNVDQRINEFILAANSATGLGSGLLGLGEEHTSNPDLIEAVSQLRDIANAMAKVLDI